MSKLQAHDVIVLGGGPAGATAALVLARNGLSVVLLDRSSVDGFKVGESLPPQAGPILERLGFFELLTSGGHLRCYGNQSAWGSPVLTDTDFIFTPAGFGWHLDRGAFERDVLHLVERAGGTVRTDLRNCTLRRTSQGHEAAGGHEAWAARFLIDATGLARFFLRQRQVGIQRDDRIVATIGLFAATAATRDKDSRTLVEACPNSWWHTALVPGNLRVVIQFTDAEGAAPLDSNIFFSRLRQTQFVAERIVGSGYEATGVMYRKPVESSRARRMAGSNWLAVGDAAMAVDPLSSQGILNAIRSGDAAATAITRYVNGDQTALVQYQTDMENAYEQYLRQRAYFYAAERRWAREPFWQGRRI